MQASITDIATFIVLALASGRVAYALTQDDIFEPVRTWTVRRDVAKANRRGEEGPYDGNYFLAGVFACPYCMTFWTSLLACIAWLALGDLVLYPALPLALWAASNTYAVKGL